MGEILETGCQDVSQAMPGHVSFVWWLSIVFFGGEDGSFITKNFVGYLKWRVSGLPYLPLIWGGGFSHT